MELLGFWIFLAAYVVSEAYQYNKGHDTILFKHKTTEEKRIREAQIATIEATARIRKAEADQLENQ